MCRGGATRCDGQTGAVRRGASPEPSFKELIVETVKAARDEGHRGLVLLIDEVQDADRQGLRTLAVTWQDLQAEADALPAGLFAAGLPQTPEIISAAATFSERFAYRTLHRLGPDASRVALVKPAGQVGVDWAPDALEAVIAQTNGYPHTLQLYADAAWARAGYPDPGGQIGMPDVEHAARQVAEDMDALFRARWNNATPVQRRFMTAMAQSLTDDRVSSRSDIAAALGRDSRAISAARAGLIDKGSSPWPATGCWSSASPVSRSSCTRRRASHSADTPCSAFRTWETRQKP